MRLLIQFAFDDVRPTEEAVQTRIGMPGDATVAPAVRLLLHDARETIAALAEPRGVFQSITKADYETVYRGEGRNAAESPLDLIAPRAEALALFVGTIGEETGKEIRRLFRKDDPALAMMLDAYASETTNRVAEMLAKTFLHELDGEISIAARVLPYSPGYCGWHVTGQRALFAAIRPEDIGVTLQPSCLMTPIKSVSGVLVAGDAAVHRFRPRWAFCDECRERDCGPRMASVRS